MKVSLKEEICLKVVEQCSLPLDVIEDVISHQFSSLQKAMQDKQIFSAQLGRWGKFLWRPSVASKRMEKELQKAEMFKKEEKYAHKLENTLAIIEELKNKMYGV